MKSYEFMQRLNNALSSMPDEEREAAVSYYEEYFADAADEERAVIKLGSPEAVAESILKEFREQNSGSPPKPDSKTSAVNTILLIVFHVFLSPVWVPVVVTAFALVFSLVVTVIALLVSLAICGLAAFVAGICAIVLGSVAFFRLATADAMFLLGTGLISTAIGAALTVGMTWLTVKATPVLINGFVNFCKIPFNKMGGRKKA